MQQITVHHPERLAIADTPTKRLLIGMGRAFRRRCPYCGHGDIFDGWFTLKRQCPYCGTVYAYEGGYFLGAYAVNLVVTEILATIIVIGLIAFTGMSVLQMQIAAVIVAIGLPVLFYPITKLIWIAIDIAFHPPDPQTGTRQI